jgi:chromosome partitioning protein
MTYLDVRSLHKSMYDVLSGRVPLADIVQPSPVPRLDVAPARIGLAKLEGQLVGEIDAHYRLKDRLGTIKGRYEFVVVDTPPALGLITVNALVAATHLLIPVQSSYFALEGTDDLLETVDRIRARPNPDLKLLGAVITLHDKRTTLSRDVHKAVTEVFGGRVFETTISKSIRLEESPAHRESIFTFAPQSSGAYEYYKLCEEVIERV